MATNKYNHSSIYKIISSKTELIYIGSTTKTLAQRLAGHKYDYKYHLKHSTTKGIVSSFGLLELGDCEILLLESVNCNNKDELNAKEREWIDKFKNICINVARPTITQVECKDYKKQWYESNKEELIAKQKERYLANKEELTAKHKERYLANRDLINQRRRELYNLRKSQKSQSLE